MLAIVIPYYKIEFFEDCLLSLYNQSDKRFNIYIGNDDSKHNPLPIINKFTDSLNVTYFDFNKNLGGKSLVKQWQRCIDLVRNEQWLMLLGDDDKLGPSCVADFYSSLEKIMSLNIKVIRYATIKINSKGEESSKKFTHPKVENSIDFLFRNLNGETRSSLSEYIFKKEAVEEIRFKELPLGWHADDLSVLEFSNFGKVFSINESIVYFRNSGKNISTQTDNLIEKNSASFLFFYYLLRNKGNFFTITQKEFFKNKLDRCYFNDKKNIFFFIKYFELHLINLDIIRYLKFYSSFFALKKSRNK